MNRNNYWLLPVVLFILLISSCTKDIQNVNRPENYVGGSFSDVFEAFWNGMNNNYMFWDIDTTDWDAMYRRYQPIFANLNVNNADDQRKSVNYFRLMTQGLIDSHYRLTFGPSALADSSIDPSAGRKQDTIHPYAYYSLDYVPGYLDRNYVIDEDTTSSDPNNWNFAVSGTINQNILYFSCFQFELRSAYESPTDNGVKRVLDYFFAKLANPGSLKGVIIDVRGNGGGDVRDLNFLVGRMISAPLTFGYTRYKNGNGRLDYTPWAPAIVTPQPGAQALNIPIVVLADAYSASLAELTTMAIHTMPNGKFIGETTWGANGPITPAGSQTFNGGLFTAANFMEVYTSSSEFKYLNGNIYEGKGFPPDIAVPYNQAALNQGHDVALETAFTYISQ
jgi:hypothetical protein